MKNIFALGAVAILLVGCIGGASSTDKVTKAGEQSGGLFGLIKNDTIQVDTGAAFKDANDVYIGSFMVGFAQSKRDTTKAGGGLMSNGMGGRSTAKSRLTGVDNATMQNITDKAYEEFVAKLVAAGYNVVDRSILTNDKDYQSIEAKPVPYEGSMGGGLLTESNKTLYFSPKALGDFKPFPGDVAGEMPGFSFNNLMSIGAAKGEKEGKKMLHVVYFIDYANADGYGGSFRSTSSITIGQGLTIVPTFSKVGIVGGQMGTFSSAVGSLTVGQPISSDKEFATVTDTTTDTDKTMEVAANVIGVLGGVGTNSKRDYEFKANPVQYSVASTELLSAANTAMVSKMATLK